MDVTSGAGTVFAVRSSTLVRWLSLVPPVLFLVVGAMVVPSADTPSDRILAAVIFAVLVLVFVGVAVWSWSMRLRVTVGARDMTVAAPFWSGRFARTDVESVHAADDDGLNHGLINWPVTGRMTSAAGVRINVGGSARVEVALSGGRQLNLVMRDRAQADSLVAALTM